MLRKSIGQFLKTNSDKPSITKKGIELIFSRFLLQVITTLSKQLAWTFIKIN